MATALITVEQTAQRHPAFTVGSLRQLIFHEHTNGLAESGAVIRLGRKVLVDEERFVNWVRTRDAVLA